MRWAFFSRGLAGALRLLGSLADFLASSSSAGQHMEMQGKHRARGFGQWLRGGSEFSRKGDLLAP